MTKANNGSTFALPRPSGSVWLSSLTINILGLGLPLVMLQIFDRVIPFAAYETLIVLVVGLFAVICAEAVLKVARAVMLNHQSVQCAHDTMQRVRAALFAEPTGRRPLGPDQARNAINGVGKLRDYLSGTGRVTLIDLPFSLLAIGAIWLLAGPLVLVPLGGFGLLLATAVIVRRAHRRLLEAKQEVETSRLATFEETLSHIQVAKANRMELGLQNHFKRMQEAFAATNKAVLQSTNLIQSLTQCLGVAFSAAIVLFGAHLVVGGVIGIAELAACAMLNGRATQPMMSAISHWASGETHSQALRDVSEALQVETRTQLPVPCARESVRVSFDHVTLRTSTAGRAVLRNASARFGPGLNVLVSGSIGNANTVFRAVLGTRPLETGRILINGHSPQAMRQFRGRDRLIYVNEAFMPFDGSLIYNIALSDDPEIIDHAYRMAGLLGIEDDINKFPNGYDTQLRESGLQHASVGFLQRLNLARALARTPQILLIDDALNAMDPAMQVRAAAALQYVGQDTLIIGYDSSETLARFADQEVAISAPGVAQREAAPAEGAQAESTPEPAQHAA
ncbi:MAG: ABC transporter transmembrane domain-containing protein [Pseudomonadota bacterium]